MRALGHGVSGSASCQLPRRFLAWVQAQGKGFVLEMPADHGSLPFQSPTLLRMGRRQALTRHVRRKRPCPDFIDFGQIAYCYAMFGTVQRKRADLHRAPLPARCRAIGANA